VEDFVLSDTDAPPAVDICRKLDGLPLAIEFAAAHVGVLGIRGLAAHLDDSSQLLRTLRRTVMPRHRTMRAAFDRSYRLLSEDEQQFFRRLGIFAGSFTADAAAAVAAETPQAQAASMDRLAELVAKSLVTADVSGPKPRFRLLETTRAYALEKLAESGEQERVARTHAEYYRDLLHDAEWDTRPEAALVSDCGRQIDNIRAALDWAFSPSGDTLLGIALTTVAIPMWIHLSLVQECRSRAPQAIAASADFASLDARLEMKLRSALGTSLVMIGGPLSEIEPPLVRALHLAQSLGAVDYQLRSLHSLWITKDRGSLTLAHQFLGVASSPAD